MKDLAPAKIKVFKTFFKQEATPIQRRSCILSKKKEKKTFFLHQENASKLLDARPDIYLILKTFKEKAGYSVTSVGHLPRLHHKF